MNTDPESGRRRRQNMIKVWSRIFLQAFTLTFLAEWGDRSQLTTIVLAAREVCIFSSDSIIQTCLKAMKKAFRCVFRHIVHRLKQDWGFLSPSILKLSLECSFRAQGYGKTLFLEILSITNLLSLSSKGITQFNGHLFTAEWDVLTWYFAQQLNIVRVSMSYL